MAGGFFANYEGLYFESLSERRFSGNGWTGEVNPDGTVFLEAARIYSDGRHALQCVVRPDGRFVTRLVVTLDYDGSTKKRILKRGKYSVADGGLTGEFRLPGGYVDDRYVSFRDEAFAKFLGEHGITAVKHADPNRSYELRDAYYGGGRCDSALFTDGNEEIGEYTDLRDDDWREGLNGNPNLVKGYGERTVSGANWSIVCQRQHEGDRHNYSVILYTLANPTSLNLPRIAYESGLFITNPECGLFIANS